MLSNDQKAKKQDELDSLKAQIKEKRAELDKLNDVKEKFMDQKNEFRKQILAIIGDVKSLKEERNALTSEVQMSKEERKNIEKKIPELRKRLTELKAKKEATLGKFEGKKGPGFLRRELEKLEQKLETEPMSFGAEKKVMARMKQIKKDLGDSKNIGSINKEMRQIIEQLDMYKTIRNASHSKVQDIAKNSQKKHENMLEESKKIDDLKKKETEAFENFKTKKEEFKAKAEELKPLLDQMYALQKDLGIAQKEDQKKKEKKNQADLAGLRKEVEEKMAKGEKLSTEDLLVLQSGGEKE